MVGKKDSSNMFWDYYACLFCILGSVVFPKFSYRNDNPKTVYRIWWGILVVLLMGTYAGQYLKANYNDKIPYYIVPKAIFSVLDVLGVFMLLLFLFLAKQFNENRLEEHAEATRVFNEGLENKRIIETKEYDVFLPSSDTSKVKYGLYWIPGALVTRKAYAEVAQKLAADNDIVVIVYNSEPLRIALPVFGCYASNIQNHCRAVQQEYFSKNNNTISWSIAGHSIGAQTAIDVMQEIDQQQYQSEKNKQARSKTTKEAVCINKLILMAYYYTKSDLRMHTNLPILVLTASNDPDYFQDDKAKKEFFSKLPKESTTGKHIEGGNHSGFGTYGPQMYTKVDGTRSISLQEQHEQIIRHVTDFITKNNDDSKKGK